MKSARYSSDMPRKMYTYFLTYEGTQGAPSFSKFARSIGITLEDLRAFRKYDEFDKAYRECNEIRRDYLIDTALTKRYDSSLVKFLLSSEYGMGGEEKKEKEIAVTLEVIGDEN